MEDFLHSAQEKPITNKDYFALPLEAYEKLPPEQLESIAKEAGVAVEKFKELILQAKSQKQEDEEKRARAVSEDREFQNIYRHIPERVRAALKKMRASKEDLEKAEHLEAAAYKIFDDPNHSPEEVKKMFSDAWTIKISNRFYELCAGRSVKETRAFLEEEIKDKISRTNIPELRDAMREQLDIFFVTLKGLISPKGQWREPPGSSGSAEKFGVGSPLNFPKHGRPRRLNDELEGW